MDNIKIIFFDIDGTLIDIGKKKISEKTIETLNRLKEKNIIICIATGRAPMTLPHIEGADFDAWLTFNGSFCYNRDDVIYSNPIPRKDVKQIIKNASAIGRPVSIASKKSLAANGRDQDLVDYYHIVKLDVEVSEEFPDIVDSEDVYQIMLGCRENEYPALLKDADGAKIVAWWDRAADIIPADGGKGNGIEKILEYYHLDKSQAMAFGDGNNDIEMFQAVGCGVAMENASPELKAVAHDFCGHAAEDGIYHYCAQHGLI